MPAYNFQPQFERPIMRDEKLHTIRAKRKRPPKVGDTCYLFTGMRRKGQCKRLKERRCVKVEDIDIAIRTLSPPTARELLICIHGGAPLRLDEAEAFARSDGFSGLYEMAQFWEKRHKVSKSAFHGDLIHWESDEEYVRRINREAIGITHRTRKRTAPKRSARAKRNA